MINILMSVLMYISLIIVILYFGICMVDSYFLHRPQKPFLKVINEKRPMITRLFRLYFRLVILLMAVVALVVGIVNGKSGGGYSFPFTTAMCTIIFCICYYCIRFLHAATVRGENCEYCCGNCGKCDIKCTSNWRYYGIRKGR